MTKSQLLRYQKRRLKIVQMLKDRLPQVAIAKKLKMTPQRVNQILAEEGIRPRDYW